MTATLWHPHAKRVPMNDAGDFTGGGWKFVAHTVQGKDLDNALRTLRAKDAAPHFVLGEDHGRRQLVQCIPLNKAARALQHTSGPETNRANAIQVEILEFAENAQHWDPDLYRYLHLLMLYCSRHVGVPMEAHHPFFAQRGYHRLSGAGWVKASGLVGHCHCPGNTHWDPGNLDAERVLRR